MPDHESYKKILDHELIRAHLRSNMIHWIIVVALNFVLWGISYALLYYGLFYWLRRWVVHVIFGALGALLLWWLGKLAYRAYTFARPLIDGRYVVVEDKIEYLEENAIKGMHLTLRGRRLRWEPILENALFLKENGRLKVEPWELKDHDGGDKIYLVLSERSRKIVLYYNADHYEWKR